MLPLVLARRRVRGRRDLVCTARACVTLVRSSTASWTPPALELSAGYHAFGNVRHMPIESQHMLARAVRAFRGAASRRLHPLQRRHARKSLRRRAPPAAVLVVCHGNICRSPFAAALLAGDLEARGVRVESAGFIVPNRPCPPEAVRVAARRGVDLSAHRSNLLTADLAHSADLIVVMDPAQGRAIHDRFGRLHRDILVLGDLDPASTTTRVIRDPVDQGVEAFEESYARIARCVAELVQVLGVA